MDKIILVRFGEIFLKGKNRGFFEKTLVQNIKKAVSGFGAEVVKVPGRYVVRGFNSVDEMDVAKRISCIPGVLSYSIAVAVETDVEIIEKTAVELMQNKVGTFKVETNRADKTIELNSMQISAKIGGGILKSNSKLKVDIKSPDFVLNIDIRENK